MKEPLSQTVGLWANGTVFTVEHDDLIRTLRKVCGNTTDGMLIEVQVGRKWRRFATFNLHHCEFMHLGRKRRIGAVLRRGGPQTSWLKAQRLRDLVPLAAKSVA